MTRSSTNTSLGTADFQALFASLPGMYWVVTPELTMVAASDVFLQATKRRREEIIGHPLFEVFPDNPDDPDATGTNNLRASIEWVLKNRIPDPMSIQKYDVPRPEHEGGGFEEKYWRPLNVPVLGAHGEVDFVLHRTEDITESIRFRQQQGEQERLAEGLRAQAQLALDVAQLGTWSWDPAQGEVLADERCREICGLSPEAPLSLGDIMLRVHPEDQTRIEAALRAALEPEGPDRYEGEFRFVHSDGSEHWVVLRGQTMFTGEGAGRQPNQILGTVLDITGRKETEVELEKLNKELESLVAMRTAKLEAVNRELETFSYSVSHDLRMPLRGIDGFSHALLEDYGESLDETARHYLRRICEGAQRMDELINDLLDLSRLSRSQMRKGEVDLSGLVTIITAELARQHPERDVTVRVRENVVAEGDTRLLRVALENLLENAWKYTHGRADAVIEFGTSDEGGERVYFVRDNGVGFDMRYADKLFMPFQRLHPREAFEGTGIGLATVQRVIHRHGGRVGAEGVVGESATFYFTLPKNTE